MSHYCQDENYSYKTGSNILDGERVMNFKLITGRLCKSQSQQGYTER